MSWRLVKLGTLLVIALWASGGQRYLHERIEHTRAAIHDSGGAVGSGAVVGGAVGGGAVVEHQSNHDCLTCSILATMTAPQWPASAGWSIDLPVAMDRPAGSSRAPAALPPLTHPARGPPPIA